MPVALPRLLEEKFADMEKQVRTLRLYRGLGKFAVVLVAFGVLAVLADRSWGHFAAARYAITASWLLITTLLFWRLVLRPQRERLTTEALAAAIETEFPNISERLSTVVELSKTDTRHHSKPLVDLLVRETAQRTKKLDFERAAPYAAAVRAMLLAGALIGLSIAATLFISGGGTRLKRVLLPWYTPKVELPYAIKASTGSVAVRRGESITLSGFLERKKAEADLPATAVAVVREKGIEKTLPMTADAAATFTVTKLNVTENFEYRLDAGAATSEWHTVTAVEPVELHDGSSLVITPPPYAMPPRVAVTTAGFAPVEGLQYSSLDIQLKFNRPAVSAVLEWHGENGGATERLPLTLNAEKTAATLKTDVLNTGSLKLILNAEHGVASTTVAAVKGMIDLPPRFEKVAGVTNKPRQVRPNEKVILEVAALDDVKVESLVLEYQINNGPLQSVAMPMKDGAGRAEGKLVWDLSKLAALQDTVKYRIRASDGRSVPRLGLKPQSVTFPEKEWGSLTISATAESLDQQDILAQRDTIRAFLEEANKHANAARQDAEKLAREAHEKPMLSTEELGRLHAAVEKANAAAAELEAAANEAALAPELTPLADAIRNTATDKLRKAIDGLKRSEHAANPKGRNELIVEAEQALEATRDKIADLIRLTEELARNRLDKRRLEKLADEVNRLSADAANATTPAEKAAIERRLQQARDELREIITNNPTLKNGSNQAAMAEAKTLADEAAAIAKAQADLDAEIARSEAAAKKQALSGNAKAQAKLNEEIETLKAATADAAKRAGDEGLKPESSAAAKEKLENGDSVNAMTEQEKQARELDRLADTLAKAAADLKDPKEAAKQLAKLQEELAKKPLDTPKQKAISTAVHGLSVPHYQTEAVEAKTLVIQQLKYAETQADVRPLAAEGLRKLSEVMLSREERWKEARRGLDEILMEQHRIARQAETDVKPLAKRVPDDATRKELATRLKDLPKAQEAQKKAIKLLDAPSLEKRIAHCADAAQDATDDLREARPLDIPTSQAELMRQLTSLKAALEGQTPLDDAVDELAKKQADVAASLKKDNADLSTQQKAQREIADKLNALQGEMGERGPKAKDSAEAAAKQFADANAEELRRKTELAKQDVQALADHLAGREGNKQRIERLAKQRQEQADKSAANAAKPTPPAEAAAAQSELQKAIDDVKQSRVGEGQAAKKQAIDALEKLKKTPNAERAPALQKAAAEALAELSKSMTEDKPKESDNGPGFQPDAGGQLASQGMADQARALAKKQREARDDTAQSAAQAKVDPKTASEQQQKQGELAKKAGELGEKLEKSSHTPTHDQAKAEAMTKAAENAKQAQQQMEKAAREEAAGRSGTTARKDAQKSLGDAKAGADAVAGDAKPDAKAAEASQAAGEASNKLRTSDAGKSKEISDAGEKIGEAAEKLGQAGQTQRNSNPGGVIKGGKPLDDKELPPDLKQYAGTPWGELPGDVRNRIITDLKAKYGEDYARVIKLYFEQLADKK